MTSFSLSSYDYPTDPCDVCTKDGKKHTLMPNEEVEYEGAAFSCAEVNNFLSPFESSSNQCTEVKDMAFGTCCFDRCSLCGQGARLDPEVLVELEVEGEDGEMKTEQGTCADIESGLFQERTTDGSEECTEARSLHYDACCFEIVSYCYLLTSKCSGCSFKSSKPNLIFSLFCSCASLHNRVNCVPLTNTCTIRRR